MPIISQTPPRAEFDTGGNSRSSQLYAVMSRKHDRLLGSICRWIGLGPRSRFDSCRAIAWCLLLMCFGGVAAKAQEEIIDERMEYNVKAVSLYAFGRYVTWPDAAFPAADSPFVIGMLGGNPFGDALDRIAAKKTLNGRAIVVAPSSIHRMRYLSHPVCHADRFAGDRGGVVPTGGGKAGAAGRRVAGLCQRGGIINFYHSGTNVRFELNPDKSVE